ncbi:hypothetical protein D3C73_1033080 [compost metagenome]
MRRRVGGSVGQGRACHRLVIKDGTISKAAACAGAITKASSAIEMVGSPKPTTPLTTPARTKTATTAARIAGVPPGRRSVVVMSPPCAGQGYGLA